MWPIFETKMSIDQSKAILEEIILVCNIAHRINPEIKKMLETGLFGDQDSTFYSGS